MYSNSLEQPRLFGEGGGLPGPAEEAAAMAPSQSSEVRRAVSWLDCGEWNGQHSYTGLPPLTACGSLYRWMRRGAPFAAVFLLGTGLSIHGLVSQQQQRQEQQQQHFLHQHQEQQQHPQQQQLLLLQSRATARTQISTPASLAEPNITVSNTYSARDNFPVDQLYPWTHLAEPYKKSLLAIDAGQDDYEACARWEVDGVELGTGPSVETVFRSPGIFPCTVTVSYPQRPLSGGHEDDSPETSGSLATVTHKFEVTVKYVRREIRDLTDRDRETFFNAVSVLQRVPSAVGREIYGDKYYSKDYFNRLHLFYGGHKDCDHWHDGAGFVTSHIALSLMYEQALQSVSPSIALPYWDFTIEGMLYDWRDFRTSSVFSDDWFGKASPRNVLMTPSRGRFGFVPVMANATEYSTLHNPYGLLRSPWNTHPEPFLTRHDRLFGYKNNRKPSGCKQYRDAARKDTWMLLTESMNAGAHGHIHELLGGAWSSDWSGFYNRTEKIILPFAHTIVPLMKYLWRTEYLQCETTCDFSVSWADCRCTLSAEAVAGQTPSEVLESSGVLSDAAGAFFYDEDLKLVDNLTDEQGHAHDRIPGYTADETKGIFTEMLRLLSTPMRIGSHYEGTSTNDVTFWVLHPTMDRLWHLNRLEDVNGEGFDETWRDDHFCYGHNPADVQPFHDLFLGQATGKGGHDQQRRAMRDERDAAKESGGEEQAAGAGTSGGSSGCGSIAPPKAYYTNQMLYELLKPDGMSIPYMYAHFEWPHCDVRGVHLRGREPRR